MPKIPQYSSEGNIRVGSAPEMGLGAVNKSARVQEEATNAIRGVEDTITKIRDFRQTAEASAYSFEQLNSQKYLADQDINFDSAPYETAIDKIGQDAAQTISSGTARAEFTASFQRQATATKWDIKNNFRAKELKSTDATIDYQGQQIVDNYGAMTEAQKITSISDFRSQLENGIKIGLYSQGMANAKFAKFQNDIATGDVEYGIANNPDNTLVELNKGKDGMYPNLPFGQRTKLVEKAQAKIRSNIKLNEWKATQIQTQGAFDLAQGLVEGKLTSEQIRKAQQAGQVDTDTAAIFDGVIIKGDYVVPDTTLLGKPDYFLRLLDDSLNDKTKVMKIVKDATESYGNKQLGENQYAYFISEAKKKFDRQAKGLKGNSSEQNIMKNAIEGIKSFSKSFSPMEVPKIAAGLLTQFIERVQAGGEPQKVKSQIIEEKLNQDIENSKLELPAQKIRMKSPDGRMFDVEENNIDKALAKGFKRAE